jgi:gamma-tubulin complex component 3
MFCFLWKLKRLEHELSTSWSLNNRQDDFTGLNVEGDMRQCHLICHEMTHFVYQLQYYFQFEVIECSWVLFVEGLSAKTDTEYEYDYSKLIELHAAFLDSLNSRGFQKAEVSACRVNFGEAQGYSEKVESDL